MGLQARHGGFLLLLMLVSVGLTGCFQQAGGDYQPASSTLAPPSAPNNVPTNPPVEPTIGTGPGESTPIQLDLTSIPATETLPVDITIISPDQPADVTSIAPNQPTLEATAEGPVEATFPAQTEAFRTPLSPLGPVTPDTPSPISVDNNATPGAPGATSQSLATPSGLITPTALPGPNSLDGCTHTVQPGDTLYRIALTNNTSVSQIRAANPQIVGDLLKPGQVVKLPNCGIPPTTVATTVPGEATSAPPAGSTTYVVRPGDTLFAIARRNGITVQAIVDANKLANPNSLKVGQQLIIPAKAG
jgi:LysM repeat protein